MSGRVVEDTGRPFPSGHQSAKTKKPYPVSPGIFEPTSEVPRCPATTLRKTRTLFTGRSAAEFDAVDARRVAYTGGATVRMPTWKGPPARRGWGRWALVDVACGRWSGPFGWEHGGFASGGVAEPLRDLEFVAFAHGDRGAGSGGVEPVSSCCVSRWWSSRVLLLGLSVSVLGFGGLRQCERSTVRHYQKYAAFGGGDQRGIGDGLVDVPSEFGFIAVVADGVIEAPCDPLPGLGAFVGHGALADGQGDADDGEDADDQGDPGRSYTCQAIRGREQ